MELFNNNPLNWLSNNNKTESNKGTIRMESSTFLTAGDINTRYTAIKALSHSFSVYAADTRKHLLHISRLGGVEVGTFDSIVTAIDTVAHEQVIALGCHNGTLIIKDIRSKLHSTIEGHNAAITVVSKHLMHEVLSGSDDGVIAIWDVRNYHKPRAYIRSHNYTVTSLNTKDCILLSTSIDGSVKEWDLIRGTLLHTHTQLTSSHPIFDAILTSKQILYTTGNDGLKLFAVDTSLQLLRSRRIDQLNNKLHDYGPFTRLINAQSAFILANHRKLIKINKQLEVVEEHSRSDLPVINTEPPPILEIYNNYLLYSLDHTILLMKLS